jgi:hypothetical protein
LKHAGLKNNSKKSRRACRFRGAPFGGGTEVELRQVFEPEDFGANLTPELRERGERLRARVAEKK